MFYSISGSIVMKDESSAAVSCSGVAFRCAASYNTLRQMGAVGDEVTLYTYLSVREDALDLFGFYDKSELETFKLLTGISGVGPKAALAILSELTPDKLSLAVAAGDSKAITRAQGVGPKIAQRVVLELKDKLGVSLGASAQGVDYSAVLVSADADNVRAATAALVELGYTQSEAALAVGKLDSTLSVEQLIKLALRSIGGF